MHTHITHIHAHTHNKKVSEAIFYFITHATFCFIFIPILSFFFFFSIFRKSWRALNWLLVTVWKKKWVWCMVIKAAELAKHQPSLPQSFITNVMNTRGILSGLWLLPGVSVGAQCADLAWADLLCAHSGLWWPVSGSGALIWASGLYMLRAASPRCSGMVSARLRGEDWLCFIGFIFQQASWDQFSGPHGRPQSRGNLEVTLQA